MEIKEEKALDRKFYTNEETGQALVIESQGEDICLYWDHIHPAMRDRIESLDMHLHLDRAELLVLIQDLLRIYDRMPGKEES